MKGTLLAAGFAAIATMPATSVSAATFVLDEVASSITLTDIGSGCIPGSCSLSASLGAAATDYTFVADNVGDSDTVNDFIDWDIVLSWGRVFGIPVPPSGGGLYDVAINLVFSSPTPASGGTDGTAGFVTILGALSGGFLAWDNDGQGSIAFGDGSVLGFDFEDVLVGGLGTSTTSGVTFTAQELPAAVPLPAAGLLLLGGLGGLSLIGRKRKAA